jgi:hypothetical protein
LKFSFSLYILHPYFYGLRRIFGAHAIFAARRFSAARQGAGGELWFGSATRGIRARQGKESVCLWHGTGSAAKKLSAEEMQSIFSMFVQFIFHLYRMVFSFFVGDLLKPHKTR